MILEGQRHAARGRRDGAGARRRRGLHPAPGRSTRTSSSTPPDAPLRYLSISTQGAGQNSASTRIRARWRLHPRPAHHPAPGETLDYWDGEPSPSRSAQLRRELAQGAHRAGADAGARSAWPAFSHVLVRRVVDDVLGLDHLAGDEIEVAVLSARPSLIASSPFQNRPEKVSGVSFRRWPRPFATAMNCWWIWSIMAALA